MCSLLGFRTRLVLREEIGLIVASEFVLLFIKPFTYANVCVMAYEFFFNAFFAQINHLQRTF